MKDFGHGNWSLSHGSNDGRREISDIRRKYRSTRRIILRAEESARVNERVAAGLREKAVDLSKKVGAFSFWEPVDGATYRAMQQKPNGSWTSAERVLHIRGDEIAEQHEQVRAADSVGPFTYLPEFSSTACCCT